MSVARRRRLQELIHEAYTRLMIVPGDQVQTDQRLAGGIGRNDVGGVAHGLCEELFADLEFTERRGNRARIKGGYGVAFDGRAQLEDLPGVVQLA